jgi:hypothetical protein
VEAEFVRALLSSPQPKIIGVRMKPYALGHSVLLTEIDSAFVAGRFPTFEELIAAAFICAHSWEENQTLLRSRLKRWATLKVWGTLAGKFDIPSATISMLQHIRSGDVYPDTEPPEHPENVRELSSPAIARTYLFLRASGFSESEAWNMPCNVANWLHASKAEEDGRITLMTQKRRQFLELARREREAAEREKAA